MLKETNYSNSIPSRTGLIKDTYNWILSQHLKTKRTVTSSSSATTHLILSKVFKTHFLPLFTDSQFSIFSPYPLFWLPSRIPTLEKQLEMKSEMAILKNPSGILVLSHFSVCHKLCVFYPDQNKTKPKNKNKNQTRD